MPHPIQPETEAVNNDSFVDIVASVVSILIVMVLMTGMKIKNTPVDAPLTGEAAEAQVELSRTLGNEQSLRSDVLSLAADIQGIQVLAAARQQERDMLALAVTDLEQRAEGTRQQIQGQAQADESLTVQIAQARARLDSLQRQQTAVANAPEQAIAVECYPTPISRTVDGRELHFQLRGNLLTHVPFETLVERFRSDAQHKVYKLRDVPEISETLPPEGGFRLRYTIERVGNEGRLKQITLFPVADDLGEPAAEALAEGSELRRILAEPRSRGGTVTIWTYPDSFDAFRRLKKELYRMGFAVAARPLHEGASIGFSPDGTKSAAE